MWDGNDGGTAIARLGGGDFVITGSTVVASKSNILLLRIDSCGDPTFIGQIGHSSGNAIGHAIVESELESGYILVGESNFNKVTSANFKLAVAKFDSNNQKIWARAFGDGSTLGGVIGRDILVTDTGYIVVGVTDKDIDSTQHSGQAFAMKLDFNGNKLWAKRYSFSGNPAFSKVSSICREVGGSGFVLAGRSKIDTYFLLKIDESGNYVTHKGFFINADSHLNLDVSIVVANSNLGYAFSSTTGISPPFQAVIGKAGLDLTPQFIKGYSGASEPRALYAASEGYVAIGTVDPTPNPATMISPKIYIVSIDETGLFGNCVSGTNLLDVPNNVAAQDIVFPFSDLSLI